MKELLSVPELENETPGSTQQILDAIANVVKSTSMTDDVTEKMAMLIYKFLVANCIKYNQEGPILPLLNLCAKSTEAVRSQIAQSNIWPYVIKGLESSGDERAHSVRVIEKFPIPTDNNTRKQIWGAIVELYASTKDMKITHVIQSLLKRPNDFDLSKLIPNIKDGLSGTNQHNCLTALKIGRAFNAQGFASLNDSSFWKIINQHVMNKNVDICKSIGKLVSRMIEAIKDFSVDPNFLAASLNLLYASDTPFEVANPFIHLLTRSCSDQKVMIFLNKHRFPQYIEQLPWRYDKEKTVAETIESCARMLTQYYGSPTPKA